jgi:hypothetical protein
MGQSLNATDRLALAFAVRRGVKSGDHHRHRSRNGETVVTEASNLETASLLRLPLESHLAYLAGLVDGEGYIGIVRREASRVNRRLSPKHTVRISVAMCERAPLDFMCHVLMLPIGKFRLKSRGRKAHIHRDCWVIDLENDHAAEVAKLLAPFLLVKRRQARLVVELRRLQRSTTKRDRSEPSSVLQFKGGVNAGHDYVVRKTSEQHLALCEAIYQECKALNKRGPR